MSFDVFDTCLTRDVGGQEGVWLLVSRRLRTMRADIPDEFIFSEMRGLAEEAARWASDKEDIPLRAVYVDLGASLGWDREFCEVAAEIECQIEFEVARANPHTLALLAREQSQIIWYLSDSVLPASAVRNMLQSRGFPDGEVRTSGDEGLLKVTGSLFRSMVGREGLNPRDICHFGNDLRGDGGGSARSGVRFVHVPSANYNRYEFELDGDPLPSRGLLGSCLAAASRRCRLEHSDNAESGLLAMNAAWPDLQSSPVPPGRSEVQRQTESVACILWPETGKCSFVRLTAFNRAWKSP